MLFLDTKLLLDSKIVLFCVLGILLRRSQGPSIPSACFAESTLFSF